LPLCPPRPKPQFPHKPQAEPGHEAAFTVVPAPATAPSATDASKAEVAEMTKQQLQQKQKEAEEAKQLRERRKEEQEEKQAAKEHAKERAEEKKRQEEREEKLERERKEEQEKKEIRERIEEAKKEEELEAERERKKKKKREEEEAKEKKRKEAEEKRAAEAKKKAEAKLAEQEVQEAKKAVENDDSECHTSKKGELCHKSVLWAMHEGIRNHPDWYPGLTNHSSFTDFQMVLHTNGRGRCKRPCRKGSGGEPRRRPLLSPGGCHTAKPGEECYKKTVWAKTEGIYSHPGWYPGLTNASSFEAFQDFLRTEKQESSCLKPCHNKQILT